MDMNSQNIEQIVQGVLARLHEEGAKTASSSAPKGVPATSKAAVLTKLENYDIKQFPIPELGDDDILVKVEGCGIPNMRLARFTLIFFALNTFNTLSFIVPSIPVCYHNPNKNSHFLLI